MKFLIRSAHSVGVCQKILKPLPVLLTFVTMLLEGPGNVEVIDNEAAVSLSQVILCNAVKRRKPTRSIDV